MSHEAKRTSTASLTPSGELVSNFGAVRGVLMNSSLARSLPGVLAWLLTACGGAASGAEHPAVAEPGGGVVEPASESERRLLGLLDTMPAGKPQTVGSLIVVADAPYFAASGRPCRGLTLTPEGKRESGRRVACKEEGKWFYVPNVLMAPVGP
jgi:hypothetical protein